MAKERADVLIARKGLLASRSKARAAILDGLVTADGTRLRDPAKMLSADTELTVDADAARWVSRGALKLLAALDHFRIDVAGRRALDLGASTGGFTQALLERGAAHVTAVDVGHGQIASEIAADPRVTVLEGTNVRDLKAEDLAALPEIVTADLSFISLLKALPAPLRLAAPGAVLIALIKPQFEAGRESVGKGGLVTDPGARAGACERVRRFLEEEMGWMPRGVIESPIRGGDGNIEYLIAADRVSPPRAGRPGKTP